MPEPATPRPLSVVKPGGRALALGFLRELFELQLTAQLATRMMPVVYALGIALSALFTCWLVYRGFRSSAWDGAAWLLLLGPATFLGLVTALRIVLEFVLAVFRIAWHIEHVAGSTQELSHNMPRFGFWRTLLYGEKSSPGPASKDAGKPKQP